VPLVPGRCAEKRHHHGLVGTSTAAAIRRASGLPHHMLRWRSVDVAACLHQSGQTVPVGAEEFRKGTSVSWIAGPCFVPPQATWGTSLGFWGSSSVGNALAMMTGLESTTYCTLWLIGQPTRISSSISGGGVTRKSASETPSDSGG
jgi:hypothetical protein